MKKKRMIPLMLSVVLLGGVGMALTTLSGCSGGGGGGDLHSKELYHHYCIPCHGELGDGNGPNAPFVDPPPADHTDPGLADRSNKKLFAIISKGGKGAARSVMMPPFGKVLAEKEIWQLVAYIRTLHPNSAPAVELEGKDEKRPSFQQPAKVNLKFPDKDTPEWKKLVRKGKKLYRRNGCRACHRLDPTGEKGGRVGPELSRVGKRLRPEWMYKWLLSPQSIYKKTRMPNFGLKNKDARAIVAFLVSQQAPMGAAGSRGDPFFFDPLS